MNYLWFKMKTINWVLIPLVFLIYSCSQEIYDLPAEERLIPSELSFDKRERYRKLPLEGAHNFRELGGFETLDNRKVKWGLLYRSDALNELSDEDLDYLQRLKLNAIIDFRSPIERNDKPDRFIENVNVHLMPIDPFGNSSPQGPNKSFEEIQREMFYGDLDLSNFLVDFNQDLVSNFSDVYKNFVGMLIKNDGLPLVFHCTAGKDRAGFASALILSILGVPRDIIIQDYLATNIYTEKAIDKKLMQIELFSFFQADTDSLRKVMGVEERYILAAFNQIDKEWGGMDRYIKEGLSLSDTDVEQIRSIYLE